MVASIKTVVFTAPLVHHRSKLMVFKPPSPCISRRRAITSQHTMSTLSMTLMGACMDLVYLSQRVLFWEAWVSQPYNTIRRGGPARTTLSAVFMKACRRTQRLSINAHLWIRRVTMLSDLPRMLTHSLIHFATPPRPNQRLQRLICNTIPASVANRMHRVSRLPRQSTSPLKAMYPTCTCPTFPRMLHTPCRITMRLLLRRGLLRLSLARSLLGRHLFQASRQPTMKIMCARLSPTRLTMLI